jgi:periplasmic protein TonB
MHMQMPMNNVLSIVRSPFVPSFVLALMVSMGMFWLMHSFIVGDSHSVASIDVMQSIDFVRLKRDTQVEPLERRKPPPPPPQPPPPMNRMQVATQANVQSAAPIPMSIPNLGVSTNVGGGPFLGELGGGAGPGIGGLFDGDIIPLQRMLPQYPPAASRAGITGWVMLEVQVNADGSVREAKVVEAQPKGLFEASAVAAVMRWKFKPKVVNGQAVAQRGSQKIEFNRVKP